MTKFLSEDSNFFENTVSVLCTYNINNTRRHTELEILNDQYPDVKEILTLCYVSFKIASVEETGNGRTIKICFDECQDD